VITSWELEQEFRPGKYAMSDYSFQTPSTDLTVTIDSKVKLPGIDSFEVYEYPGDYEKKAEGEQFVKIRMEEEEAVHLVINGSSGCRAFTSGYKFNLVEHYRRDVNIAYLLTEVRHAASAGDSYESGGSSEREAYTNSFKCIPHAVAYRPSRTTSKPTIQGFQTAVVVGKAGEEIWVDKFGRVKVQFHWDREGKGDEKSSCWIRVATTWAGKQWGTVHIPRVGQEVVVGFEEGDPDRPLILGSVYNAVQLPAYGLPSEQTKSGIKSMSSKGGGGFNEIRFEDKKGSEQVFINSERQMDLNVKKSRFESIGESAHLTVGKDQLEKINGDKHLTVAGDQNQKQLWLSETRNTISHLTQKGIYYAPSSSSRRHAYMPDADSQCSTHTSRGRPDSASRLHDCYHRRLTSGTSQ
jgi:type VI secretion system secreted protein VgrG